jgi:photosystem II stability/assembly factor-like uncharacterized protein|tara:strand:+ start:8036 stop:9055 length:1020 start_codon:yes stop_codon:yes gene_type:complete
MIFFSFLILSSSILLGQNFSLEKLSSNVDASFRGLDVINKKLVWVSGTKGTVLKTTDGGNTWENISVPNSIETDFRDIEGFDKNTAIVMGISSPARFYKTKNGGKNWDLVYFNEHKEVFFDGMSFWDSKNGIAFSDPVNGQHYLIRTKDGGETWQEIPSYLIPKKLEIEYGFAASGTGIPVFGNKTVWLGMGGLQSRVFKSNDGGMNWIAVETPLVHGGQSTGIYSLAFKNKKVGIAVGGDYTDQNIKNTMVFTENGGITWHLPENQINEYRECVAHYRGNIFIAVGPSGMDITKDNGKNWTSENREVKDLSAIAFAKTSGAGFAVGKNGKIYKLIVKN